MIAYEMTIQMSTQDNIRLDEEFIAAWNSHDADRALSVLADDVVWQDVGSTDSMRGKSETRQYLQSWFSAFPDLKATVKNRVATEDQVAAEIEFTGTNTGPLQLSSNMPPIPPTGKKVVGKGTYFVKVRNNKGVEVHSYPDAAGLMTQLGITPQPPKR